MTIKNGLIQAVGILKKNINCKRPILESELLLAFHLQKDRIYLHIFDNIQIKDVKKFQDLVERRANNEPYEYIVGEVSFYNINLYINSGVLIPRPETEILVEKAISLIKKYNIKNIAEIGVGSGAISIVLAKEFLDLNIISTDISDSALTLSLKNIKKFKLENRIKIVKSYLLDEIDSSDIELVVTNPPYIANDFPLEKNIIDYEPAEALFGGNIGNELLKEIIISVKKNKIKYLLSEIGYNQKYLMQRFFNKIGIKDFFFYKDLSGLNRGFFIEFNK